MGHFKHIPNNRTPVPGWVGGFSTSNPAFAYPNPDLSCVPMTGNMDNVNLLTRQAHVLWPEFSWEVVPGDSCTRLYQMFAPDISRAGYDDAGRFWSIICPQQGTYSPLFGSLNVEVTVTGQRGWMNEKGDPDKDLLAADLTVTGKVWFAPSAKDRVIYNVVKTLAEAYGPFPLDKAHAIQVTTRRVGTACDPILPLRSGVSPAFPNPGFAMHTAEAWCVANVAVEIGPITSCGNPVVDEFNAVLMDIFNLAMGNILQPGNILTWNVWFDAPTHVDRRAWKRHAKFWRKSIDTGHGSPDGPGTEPRPYGPECPPCHHDGSVHKPAPQPDWIEKEWRLIKAWFEKHCDHKLPDALPPDWVDQGQVVRRV